jgi:hypothetical protein
LRHASRRVHYDVVVHARHALYYYKVTGIWLCRPGVIVSVFDRKDYFIILLKGWLLRSGGLQLTASGGASESFGSCCGYHLVKLAPSFPVSNTHSARALLQPDWRFHAKHFQQYAHMHNPGIIPSSPFPASTRASFRSWPVKSQFGTCPRKLPVLPGTWIQRQNVGNIQVMYGRRGRGSCMSCKTNIPDG